jgi:hypothetical protein
MGTVRGHENVGLVEKLAAGPSFQHFNPSTFQLKTFQLKTFSQN